MNCSWASHMWWHTGTLWGLWGLDHGFIWWSQDICLMGPISSLSPAFMTDLRDATWTILRAPGDCDDISHTSCLERSRILLSVFVILSQILRLDHCDRRMTKQIINNFPDLDLKDILHNSAVTTRRTPAEMIFLITLIAPIVISKLFPSLFFPPKIALGHKHETMNSFYHGFAFW